MFSYQKKGNTPKFSSRLQVVVDSDLQFLDKKVEQSWRTTSIPLSKGRHSILIDFSFLITEDNLESINLTLREIKISGVYAGAVSCRPCVNCARSNCIENTFLNELNKCENCPEGQFSNAGSVGSSSCSEKRVCNSNDYESVIGNCESDKRIVSFVKKEAAFCTETTGRSSEEVECYPESDLCNEHEIFKDRRCQDCPAETVTVKEAFLTGLNKQLFVKSCENKCRDNFSYGAKDIQLLGYIPAFNDSELVLTGTAESDQAQVSFEVDVLTVDQVEVYFQINGEKYSYILRRYLQRG